MSRSTFDPPTDLEDCSRRIEGVNFKIQTLRDQLHSAERELQQLTYVHNRLNRLRREANGEHHA